VRVLVCGGRRYTDYDKLQTALDKLVITMLISGGARGADALAEAYSMHRSIPMIVYPAEWKKHGLSAGPKRNQQMLDEGKPDLVVACPGGRGTADMVQRSRKAKLQIIFVT